MLSWIARFIEAIPAVHWVSLKIWRLLPARVAGILRGLLTRHWVVGGVAVVLDESTVPNEILLVRHSYRRKGAWGLPGGSLESPVVEGLQNVSLDDQDDILALCLKRELYEELGIEITPVQLLHIDAGPNIKEEPGPLHLIFYFRCYPVNGVEWLKESFAIGNIKPRSAEIDRIAFVPVNEIFQYDVASVHLRFLRRKFGLDDLKGILHVI
ncbi:MAG: NUDIX hydrolase [Acidobacteriia bacterium]|nr:NUDIX hydrolase [Terriglobia bacterium]